jgi:hypothetical protein
MKRIMTTPKALGEIRSIMKTAPEEKIEVVVKVEGMEQEEVSVVAVVAKGEEV